MKFQLLWTVATLLGPPSTAFPPIQSPASRMQQRPPTTQLSSVYESEPLLEDTSSGDRYNLLWSPGFAWKLAGTSVILWAVRRWAPSASCHPVLSNIALPLLASACCILQLALNILSIGCAGWNTWLGPIRPYFLGLLMVTSLSKRHAWRWLVALLPEAVHVYNQRTQQPAALSVSEPTTIVELDIASMGCVACIQSIQNALLRQPNVVHAQASLHPLGRKGGSATIKVLSADDVDVNSVINDLIDAVENVGFDGASVVSVREEL